MKYEEVIDYLSENVKKRKKGKSIREQVNETKCEMNERGITFDETSLEICRIIKEDSNSSYTDMQNILNSVVSVLAVIISFISLSDTFTDKIVNNIGLCTALSVLYSIFVLVIGLYCASILSTLGEINKGRIDLRNKAIAALIQMQAEKNKKETGKDEKNS